MESINLLVLLNKVKTVHTLNFAESAFGSVDFLDIISNDEMFIQKIDLKNKKITVGLFNPITYDLSSKITKFETFGFGIEPEILIDPEAE